MEIPGKLNWQLPKHGFFAGRADELIGKLVNVDIGIELPEQEQ